MNLFSVELIAPFRAVRAKAPTRHVQILKGLVTRITRVGDCVEFEGPAVVPGTLVPWSNVAGCVRLDEPQKPPKVKRVEIDA